MFLLVLFRIEKHLHERGAYLDAFALGCSLQETSPRAWSLPITSGARDTETGKHLHERGAYMANWFKSISKTETSPRAWSLPIFTLPFLPDW